MLHRIATGPRLLNEHALRAADLRQLHAKRGLFRLRASPLDPDAQLGYQLVRVADQVSRRWHAVLRAHGINPRQFNILALLAHDPGSSQAELARRVMITPQSMCESLASLLAEGLIARDDPTPGLAASVQLTAAGRKLLTRANPLVEACNQESFARLSQTERATLSKALAKLLKV